LRPSALVGGLLVGAVLRWRAGSGSARTSRSPVDDGRHPVFNGRLFAADPLLPIVNLGQDGYRRFDGTSQWIGSAPVAAGWILATTAAAGITRILKGVA
jgi:hypothetical protein